MSTAPSSAAEIIGNFLDDIQLGMRHLYISEGLTPEEADARIALAQARGPLTLREVEADAVKTTRSRGYIAEYRPQKKTVALLAAVDAVLKEYRKHWPLTVRQIFYRLVGAYGFDKSERFYGTLCHHIANARRARVIPFDAIRDDGVTTYTFEHFADADAFRAMVRKKAENYERDLMADQRHHVEVWCEAAGMLGQLANITERYSIHAYSSSGFDSLTAKKMLADRICRIGRPAVILHLGDYDPSGESMFKVIEEDVGAFVKADRPHGLCRVEFKRVCLTTDQVQEYSLPTAPAKLSDTRSRSWEGETCQLEALAPDQIADLLDTAIRETVDIDRMNANIRLAEAERRQLTRLLPAPNDDSTTSRKTDGGAA